MRIANYEGRLVVVTGGEGHEIAHDVEKNSGGRFGPEPQAIYEDWDAFTGWAAGARWEGGAPVRPNGLGSPVPAPRQVFGIGLNYRDHAAESGLPVPSGEPPVFTKFPICITGPLIVRAAENRPSLLLSHIFVNVRESESRRAAMTAQTDTSRRDDLIARNLAAVETHFHNETPETIDQAIAVYTDDIVWEVPARGLVLRSIEDVKQEYLKIFGSMNIHKIVNLHRFATEEWVFDDSIFEWTITGDGFRNCPYPPGTTVSVRLLHAFQCRDGKICREHGYEIWRDINDHARVQDDIPTTATVEVFG